MQYEFVQVRVLSSFPEELKGPQHAGSLDWREEGFLQRLHSPSLLANSTTATLKTIEISASRIDADIQHRKKAKKDRHALGQKSKSALVGFEKALNHSPKGFYKMQSYFCPELERSR